MTLFGNGLSAQLTVPGIYVGEGAVLYSGDGFYVSGEDSLIVEGTLVIEDSLIVGDPSLSRIQGVLRLLGTDTLLVDANGLRVDSLEIATNDNVLSLLSNLAINQKLLFTTGNIDVSGQKLVLGTAVRLVYDGAYSTSVPIMVSDGGEVVLESFSDSIYLPIGFSNEYLNAIALKNTGATDTFSVSVMENVMENGQNGNSITDDVVQVSWLIRDSASTAYNLSAWLYWDANQEGSGFDNTKAGVASFESNDWDLNVSSTSDASSLFIERSNITDVENLMLAVADASSELVDAFNLVVKVYLEGAFDQNSSEMTTSLNSLLPDSASDLQAYGGSLYNYSGEANFELTGVPNSDVVDWVLVELRQASSAAEATSSTTVLTLAGLLLKDGSIVTTDGITALNTGELSSSDNLYLVVRHRNHADIMSAVAVSSTDGVFTFDFTTALTQAYGSNSMSELTTGVYGMWSGDVNADGVVKYTGTDNDATEIFNAINGNASVINTLTGYYWYDVNMDGVVKYTGSDNDATEMFNTVDGNSSVINTRSSSLP